MSKRTLMIVGAVFLLLMLGTGVAFFVLWGKVSASKSKNIELLENVAESTLSTGRKTVFPMKTFVVNLADAGGKRYLRLGMVLELDDVALASEIEEKLPQVRDKILMLLPSKTFDDIKTFEGKMMLKKEIMNRLNSLLKEGKVNNLYFEEFVVQ
ncbi:MAG: flagellar basal body protein FliL [Deltaproteobacteria bacterium]|nr:flagellar basal body protein FliL [Deltaproteobacteria bacterium]